MEAVGNEKITSCPLPDWFSPCAGLALDAASRLTPRADASSTGEDFLLFDRQIDIATAATTTHIAYQITSQAGLSNGAQLTLAFDPSYESLTYHFIRLWRNGQAQDRLDLSEIKVLQQERDLDRQMYNGQLSTLLLLHDVRVGDIIEYACTRTGTNPVFNGKFVDTEHIGWVSPMRQQRLRVIVPGGRTIHSRVHGARALTHRKHQRPNGDIELWWEGLDLAPIVADSGAPDWFVQFPYIELSEFADWAAVAGWATPLYALNEPLSPEIKEKLASLTRGIANEETKVIAILDFLQREIRYLGIELGPNSHQPHQPGTVFGQRFGDCKDKTLLLCAMLRELNLPAHPVLVNTYRRDRIKECLPSPYAFNHVIAKVLVNRQSFYLDATQSYQRGNLARRNPADDSAGLPVMAAAQGLESWTGQPLAQAKREIREVYDLAGYDKPATVAISYRYEGETANGFRYYLANASVEEVTRDFVDAHKRAHPNLQLATQLRWDDDEARNAIQVNFTYTVPDLWKRQNQREVYEAVFYPWPLRDYINQPDNLTRTAPLSLNHPVNIVVRTIINFHDDWTLSGSKEKIESPWYAFSSAVRYQQRTLEIAYQWTSHKNHIPTADLATHVAKLEEIRRHAGYTLTRNAHLSRVLEKFSWNWLSLGLGTVTVVGWIWFGRWLLLRPPPTEPPVVTRPELQGLGGWLLLPALSLVVRPIILLYSIGQGFDAYFDQRIWVSYMSTDSGQYQPAMAGLILFELTGNLSLLLLTLIAAVLFFQCRHRFPSFMIALLLATPVYLLLDYFWADSMHLGDTSGVKQTLKSGLQGLFAACIWVPYFLMSRRVKATFIR